MRLDFNVLWIDDQPARVESYQERLSIHIEGEGFRLNAVKTTSFKEAESYLADDIFLDNIDLVLVDYDLGSGSGGEAAVAEIRDIVQYKDIIFYSSLKTSMLKKLMLENEVEGVFCAHRDNLADIAIGVFDALVKKVLDLDHTRGIVMGATSDIDHMVNDGLHSLVTILGGEGLTRGAAYALKRVDDRLARFQEKRQAFAGDPQLPALLAEHELFTAADKLRLLKAMLDLHFPGQHTQLKNAVGNYINEVPAKRNKLGHVRLVAKDARRHLRGRDGEEVGAQELKELRQALIAYREHFEQLSAILDGEQAEGGQVQPA